MAKRPDPRAGDVTERRFLVQIEELTQCNRITMTEPRQYRQNEGSNI